MVDLAAIFHWSPEQLFEMPVSELMDWRERAIKRFNQMYGGESGE
ncbi:MAG: GpE family phage tail protein [Zymomonas mobilis]